MPMVKRVDREQAGEQAQQLSFLQQGVEAPPEPIMLVHGARIYPVTLRTAEGARERYAAQARENIGTDRVFGDTLHLTQSEAVGEAERAYQREQRHLAACQELHEQRLQEAAALNARKADTLCGLITEHTPPHQAERMRLELEKQRSFERYGVRTIREHIDALAAAGQLFVHQYEEPALAAPSRRAYNRMTQSGQDAWERRSREAGTKTVYGVGDNPDTWWTLGKTAYRYAVAVLQQRDGNTVSPGVWPGLMTEK